MAPRHDLPRQLSLHECGITMTRTCHLEELPPEILDQCCQYLDSAFKPSLLAFSLTSRRCRSAACAWIFRRIRFSVTGRIQLQRDVEECLRVLKAAHSLRNVRTLMVDGYMPHDKSGDSEREMLRRCARGLRDYVKDDALSCPSSISHKVLDFSPPAIVQENDESWAPIARLINQLPALRDFIYGALNQLSPCLLKSLEQHEPYCRLHHLKFYLRSLLRRDPSSPIDSYECKLATSRCLHTIIFHCRNHCGDDDFNQDAVLQLASGAAPNLNSVTMWNAGVSCPPRVYDDSPSPWLPWGGLPCGEFDRKEQQNTSKRGRLTGTLRNGV